MHNIPAPVRQLIIHPELESIGSVLRGVGVLEPLSRNHRNEIDEKLRRHLFGKTRRNVDYKHLVGYPDWGLVELRWDWVICGNRTPIRLIGSEIDQARTVFCVWHFKNLDTDLDQQRQRQNMACAQAIERMKRLESSFNKL